MWRAAQRIVFRSSTLTSSNVSKLQLNVLQIRFYNRSAEVQKWVETLDESQQQRVRFLQNELALLKVENKHAPELEKMTIADYEHAIKLSSNQRHKYYNYLYKAHLSENAEFIKHELRKRIRTDKKDNDLMMSESAGHIEYGLGKGSLIPKIYNKTVDKWRNVRSLWQYVFDGPKIIFDCSYTEHMTARENKETAKQMAYSFALNRMHREPFLLYFCGIKETSMLWHNLQKSIPTLESKPLPVRIHSEDVCDVFPHEKLVFLTPDAPNSLKEYNPDDHYIISGLVERGDQIPLSLAKAKKLNIRAARLPMESYRTCRINKSLTLDQMLQVMLEIKFSGDWNQAFRYVAARKFF